MKFEVTTRTPISSVISTAPDLKPPIIIIGMHRSGTSLVAGMLTALGVFVDPAMCPPGPGESLTPPDERQRRNGYGEADFFRLLNDTILARSGAVWDHVQPFLDNRDTAWMTRTNLLLMHRHLKRRLSVEFLSHMPEWVDGCWGWKDPRNSVMLPYWLQLFPEARILHVRRNPEDIADSLIRRARKQADDPNAASVPLTARFKSLGRRLVLQPRGVAASLGQRLGIRSKQTGTRGSVLDYDYCLHLTEQYVQECDRYRSYGNRYLEVEYEEVMKDPASMALRLSCFAGVPTGTTRLLQAAHFVQMPHSQEVIRSRTEATGRREAISTSV